MPRNSQEGQESQEQQKEQEFVKEFSEISNETVLRQYEEKNRDRIASAPYAVRDEFDRTWQRVTGKSYYQPITTAPSVNVAAFGKNNVERGDPKSRNYRAKVLFSSIEWSKSVNERKAVNITLAGVEKESGLKREIYRNLTLDRVEAILGPDLVRGIEKKSANYRKGDIKAEVEIEVEGFWEVIFSPQTNPNDTVNVIIPWEGQTLLIERMKHVILPGFYIEAVDNATRPHYMQTPEHDRKIVGTIQEYPYMVSREATYEEYKRMKETGDRITAQKRREKESLV